MTSCFQQKCAHVNKQFLMRCTGYASTVQIHMDSYRHGSLHWSPTVTASTGAYNRHLQLAVSFACKMQLLVWQYSSGQPQQLVQMWWYAAPAVAWCWCQLIWPVRWWKCPNSLHHYLCIDRYWDTKYPELIAGNAMDVNLFSSRLFNPPNGGSYRVFHFLYNIVPYKYVPFRILDPSSVP